jgi:LysR family transcriptional activator of nhaA
MDWINYHHLLYFWVAAREGSITKACKKLHLTQPTVSGQIQALEKSLRAKLFDRSGRSIALTDTGRLVYRYADEIFTLGRELQDALHDRPTGQPVRFAVGVADALPKVLVHRLLAPAREIKEHVRVTCIDGNPEALLAQLALHELDLVISDFPASPRLGMKAFTHLLGGCGITFFAQDDLAREYRKGFPASLTGAPMLLPRFVASLVVEALKSFSTFAATTTHLLLPLQLRHRLADSPSSVLVAAHCRLASSPSPTNAACRARTGEASPN